MRNIGIIIGIVGLVMLLIPGFNYVTQKKVVDLGKLEIKKDETHHVQWSPIIGGILLVGGVVIFATGKSKA